MILPPRFPLSLATETEFFVSILGQSRNLTARYRSQWKREPCVYCGHRAGKKSAARALMTREHITPQSLGGRNCWENVATACGRCNCRRGQMPIIFYLVMLQIEEARAKVGKHFTKKEKLAAGFHRCLNSMKSSSLAPISPVFTAEVLLYTPKSISEPSEVSV